MVVRSVGVISLGKIMGLMYALFGLLMGGFFALLSFFGAAIGAAQGVGGAWLGMLFGGGAVVIMPFLYGFFGFLGGVVTAALYNGVAALVGGLELDLQGGATTGARGV